MNTPENPEGQIFQLTPEQTLLLYQGMLGVNPEAVDKFLIDMELDQYMSYRPVCGDGMAHVLLPKEGYDFKTGFADQSQGFHALNFAVKKSPHNPTI